ncbi:MAG: hypothetical protein ACFUZC_02980 [Chthoniobacteraceae bacterium]
MAITPLFSTTMSGKHWRCGHWHTVAMERTLSYGDGSGFGLPWLRLPWLEISLPLSLGGLQ